ncbi:MAG: HEAT repeat domain-containing protein [Pseudomonadota bacterium]
MQQEYPWILDAIANFAAASIKQKSDYLETFYRHHLPLPLQAQELICDIAAQSNSFEKNDAHGDLSYWMIQALSRCQALKPRAIPVLRALLYSDIWYIRSYAAVSLGKIGIDDTEIISRIGDLLSDHEGHDDYVYEYALMALTHIGKIGQQELPKIYDLAYSYILDENSGGWHDPGQYLPDCLVSMEVRTPEAFEILYSLARQRRYSGYDACLALALLDAPDEESRLAIANYICGEHFDFGNAKKLHDLINALINVAGPGHPLIEQCLRHLSNDYDEEVACIAKEYLLQQFPENI